MAALSTAIVAAAAIGAGASMYSAHQQTQAAKKQQKLEQIEQFNMQQQIAQEKANAEKERKGLLTAQRYQMGLDSTYSTSGTSSVGRDLTTGESTLG